MPSNTKGFDFRALSLMIPGFSSIANKIRTQFPRTIDLRLSKALR